MQGSCLCGAVTFSGRVDDPTVTACHCSQCRKWSGHLWASFHLEDPQISGDSLRWFESSPGIRRGFCATCGTSLFWQPEGRSAVSVSAGAIDNPTGLRLSQHIYVADRGDYYEITDDLPQRDD